MRMLEVREWERGITLPSEAAQSTAVRAGKTNGRGQSDTPD